MSSGTSLDDSSPLFRTRSAVAKLLERLKSEKPVINVVSNSLEVARAATRLKFPDPKKDCCMHLKLSGYDGKLSWPICYENQEDDELCSYAGLRYILQVKSVKRFSLNGNPLPSDKPVENFYCCLPFSSHRKGASKKNLGYWFRFLGKDAIFRVTIALKLDIKNVRRLARRSCLSETICKSSGIISKVEIEILSRSKASRQGVISEKGDIINVAKISPSLYFNKEYKSMLVTFKALREKLNFEDLEKFCAQSLEKLDDNDLRVVVLLEQSKEACRKKHYEKSKALLREAVDHARKCKNKTLLMGRAYVYLSYVHQNDGYLGNADECLAIARKKLLAMEACEDIGDLFFQEGLILLNFVQKMPKFADDLTTEAMHKFEQAAVQFENGLKVDDVLDKICSSYIRLASLILQKKASVCNRDCSVEYNIATANTHLEWVKEHLEDLSEKTKFHFYVCVTELLYEKQHFEKAKESLDVAFKIAKSCEFEEQIIWKGLPGNSINGDSHMTQELREREQADWVVEDFAKNGDVLLGYLADVSS